jgi:hypothetical protein
VTEVADDALIHTLCTGAIPNVLWKASIASCADFSSAATIVDHDWLPCEPSVCHATFPTCAPARKAIRIVSIAIGIKAVRESAAETAVAARRPVHRPTNLASELGEIYDLGFSSKALQQLASCDRIPQPTHTQ